MTDQEWFALRERKRALCKNGDLACGENMVPHTIGKDGVPWGFVSRQYVERLDEICDRPGFKESVELAKKTLNEPFEYDEEGWPVFGEDNDLLE